MFKKLLLALLLTLSTLQAMDQRLYQYPDAKADYVKATNEKDQSAAFDLALFYETQLNDNNEAISWYKRAYSFGSSRAALNLGLIYHKEKKYDMAFNWYIKAYQHNDIKSAYNIAILYEDQSNNNKAIEWYIKSDMATLIQTQITKLF